MKIHVVVTDFNGHIDDVVGYMDREVAYVEYEKAIREAGYEDEDEMRSALQGTAVTLMEDVEVIE